MKTLSLECEMCGTVIKPEDDGLKYRGMYFCSQECLDQHVDWDTYPIEPTDFEREGEEYEDEEENEEE